MPRALDVRPTPVLMLALALCAALLALAPAGPAHAQAPAGVVDAATAHLAEQLDADPAGLEVLRSEAVVWSDGCLGVNEPDIACTMALVDGFALWLSDGDVAYRYHTDATGTVVRLAESGIALGEVAGAPLPEGEAGPAPPPEPAPLPEGEDEPAPPPSRARTRRRRRYHTDPRASRRAGAATRAGAGGRPGEPRSPARLRQRRPRQRHRRPGVGLGRHRGGRAERDRDGRRLPPLAPLPASLSRPR